MPYAQLFGRDDQVVVKNPLNRDYIFRWDSKQYLLRANAKQPMAGWMAEHYIKEMTNLLMQQNGKSEQMMMEKYRQPYYDMLVISHSQMASIDSEDNDGDIVILGEETTPTANTATPKKKKGVKLAHAEDDIIDSELNIDDLPKDEDLYPAPKKKSAKKAVKSLDDLEPGELAAIESDDEDDADISETADDEEAFPDVDKT